MPTNPLQFAKECARLRADLASDIAPDHKLLRMMRFWPELAAVKDQNQYGDYFHEFIPTYLDLIESHNIVDLDIQELEAVNTVISEISSLTSQFADFGKVAGKARIGKLELAKKLFYVGDVERGLAVCADIAGTAVPVGNFDGQGERDALRELTEKVGDSKLASVLKSILTDWDCDRESIHQDRIQALFVERDNLSGEYRGRMRTLEGAVDLFKKDAPGDELTFDNQLRAPDDPFVGSAFNALDAVRRVCKRMSLKAQGNAKYHAHFSVLDSKHTFTGDSIGLAVGLVTYVQLLKREISWQDRFLASGIAVTGGVDNDGLITPCNPDTLAHKIKRAFFSPARFLILPDSNLEDARRHVDALQTRHPNRHLGLISVCSVDDALDDRNVIREQKVCMIPYLGKVGRRYSRMAAVQVPILLLLLYLLVCLIYPKAWIWFDWRIDHIEFADQKIVAVNKGGTQILESQRFGLPFDTDYYKQAKERGRNLYVIADFDDDGKDDLFFSAIFAKQFESVVYYYNPDRPLDSVVPSRSTAYQGDGGRNYQVANLMVIDDADGNHYLLTNVSGSLPARTQILLFDSNLKLVSGPYLHSGNIPGMEIVLAEDTSIKHPRLIAYGVNNRYSMAALVELDPWDMSGVSPPWDNEYFIESGMPKGSQLVYVGLPETELSAESTIHNQVIDVIFDRSAKTWEVHVQEAYDIGVEMPTILYHLDSLFLPSSADFGDGADATLLQRYAKLHWPEGRRKTTSQLSEHLIEKVVVYHHDTLVHNLAAGIDFHKR
jgi:hypothetical protein